MRRTFWLAAGVGVSWWVRRKARTTAARYRPERVGAEVADTITRVRGELRAALAEGAVEMREREAAIRREIGDPRAPRAVDAAVIERTGDRAADVVGADRAPADGRAAGSSTTGIPPAP